MTTFTEQSRHSTAFTDESKNSAAFSEQERSDSIVFEELTMAQIEAETFDGLFRGIPIDDWHFNDPLSTTTWSNSDRS